MSVESRDLEPVAASPETQVATSAAPDVTPASLPARHLEAGGAGLAQRGKRASRSAPEAGSIRELLLDLPLARSTQRPARYALGAVGRPERHS